MDIKYKDYYIEAEDTHFNLYRIRETKKGRTKGEERKDYFAFGITMKRAILKITHLEATKDQEIVTLDEFIRRYEKERKALEDFINENIPG